MGPAADANRPEVLVLRPVELVELHPWIGRIQLEVERRRLSGSLRRTFRSTNPIESLFDKVEYRVKRVKNWKGRTQIARWAASSLLLHEKEFRRIRGYKQMRLLLAALENVDTKQAVA